MKKKEEIYVVIDTPKKAKKVKKVLDMFGLQCISDETLNECVKRGYVLEYAYDYWLNSSNDENKTEVSIKELRNLLAIDNLKEGDVVVTKVNNEKIIAVYDRPAKHNLALFQAKRWVRVSDGFKWNQEGCFDTLLRYATEEEKALLEDNPKSIEAGKWYTFAWEDLPNDIRGIYFIEKVEDIKVWFSYGIDFIYNEWQTKDWASPRHVWKEATKEQVEQALIKEAKKRYKVGDKLSKITQDYSLGNRIFSEHLDLQESDKTLWIDRDRGYSSCIFKNGKWAEIVEPSFVESSDKINVAGEALKQEISIKGRTRVVSGGAGAYGANGITGYIVDRSEVDFSNYSGECNTVESDCYIKTDEGKYWGLCKGYIIERLEESEIKLTLEIKDIATLQVIQKTLKELEEKLTKLI